MASLDQLCRDYERVEKTIRFLENNVSRQPELAEISSFVGLSEHHFQRLFSRWVGISPKRFLQFLTHRHAKKMIEGSGSLLEAAFQTGLSGGGRLYDLFVSCEAVTPGQAKKKGEGLEIEYGFFPTPFGRCLLAATDLGLVHLTFLDPKGEDPALAELQKSWPRSRIRERPDRTRKLAEAVFSFPHAHEPAPVHLFVQGTNFQIRVWEALLRIPLGRAVTYGDIARHIGMPDAARAVGNAVGANPIPFLIPCHRVIRNTGLFGYYGGGPVRKKAMLGWESARVFTDMCLPRHKKFFHDTMPSPSTTKSGKV